MRGWRSAFRGRPIPVARAAGRRGRGADPRDPVLCFRFPWPKPGEVPARYPDRAIPVEMYPGWDSLIPVGIYPGPDVGLTARVGTEVRPLARSGDRCAPTERSDAGPTDASASPPLVELRIAPPRELAPVARWKEEASIYFQNSHRTPYRYNVSRRIYMVSRAEDAGDEGDGEESIMSFHWVRVSGRGVELHTVLTVGCHGMSDAKLEEAIASADPMTACWRTVERLRKVGHVDMFSPLKSGVFTAEVA